MLTSYDIILKSVKDSMLISGLKNNVRSLIHRPDRKWIIGRLDTQGRIHFLHFTGLFVGDPLAAEFFTEEEADDIINTYDHVPNGLTVLIYKDIIRTR
jgi:hypothetical protein